MCPEDFNLFLGPSSRQVCRGGYKIRLSGDVGSEGVQSVAAQQRSHTGVSSTCSSSEVETSRVAAVVQLIRLLLNDRLS